MERIETTIKHPAVGLRLDRWLSEAYPAVPRALVQKSLRTGMVRLNGKKSEAETRLKAGDVVGVPPHWAEVVRVKQAGRVNSDTVEIIRRNVLYKDALVLAINKPAGLAVQGGSGQREHVDGLLDELRFGAEERPRLVHRLDRDTSGVLLLARTREAAQLLTRAFAARTTEKIYWALVMGVPAPRDGVIDAPLIKRTLGKDSRTMLAEEYERVVEDEVDGKDAKTAYRTIEFLARRLAWVEMQPLTGRTHQLRAHMAGIRHPIVGDGKYGGKEAFVEGLDIAPQLHLHARRITLSLKGKPLTIEAPLPPHMQKSWQELGFSEKAARE